METRDLLARAIPACEDAEEYAERLRARLHGGDLEGAERALAMLGVKLRAGEAVVRARRARLR